MQPLIHLNYPLQVNLLLSEAEELRAKAIPYVDGRYHTKMEDWRVVREYGPYGKQILHDFGINGRPRFYWLQANSVLGTHTDHNTTCSINFVLSKNLAPVIINGVDYFYTQALLNTSIPHSVVNGPEERILFKISIFDETYEQVAEKIKYKLGHW
jgi:hypothetical protein